MMNQSRIRPAHPILAGGAAHICTTYVVIGQLNHLPSHPTYTELTIINIIIVIIHTTKSVSYHVLRPQACTKRDWGYAATLFSSSTLPLPAAFPSTSVHTNVHMMIKTSFLILRATHKGSMPAFIALHRTCSATSTMCAASCSAHYPNEKDTRNV